LNNDFAQSKPWETMGRRATKLNKTGTSFCSYRMGYVQEEGITVLYASRAAKEFVHALAVFY
jgi:hypothetical protein